MAKDAELANGNFFKIEAKGSRQQPCLLGRFLELFACRIFRVVNVPEERDAFAIDSIQCFVESVASFDKPPVGRAVAIRDALSRMA
jgi:hypothetical protein